MPVRDAFETLEVLVESDEATSDPEAVARWRDRARSILADLPADWFVDERSWVESHLPEPHGSAARTD